MNSTIASPTSRGSTQWLSAAEAKLLFCLAANAVKEVDGRPEPALTRRALQRFYTGNLLFVIARRHRILLARRRHRIA